VTVQATMGAQTSMRPPAQAKPLYGGPRPG